MLKRLMQACGLAFWLCSGVANAQPEPVRITMIEGHPLGRIKDFLPCAAKIKASGAQAVLTGNWGNDLTLVIKAARKAGVGRST